MVGKQITLAVTIIYKIQNKCQMCADANQLSMTAYL